MARQSNTCLDPVEVCSDLTQTKEVFPVRLVECVVPASILSTMNDTHQ